MKEKYNFEFPFTTNYGFLRAILDMPQVDFMSAGSARGILLSKQVNMANLKSAKPLWSFFPQKMPVLSYLTKASKIMGSPKAKKKFLTSTCFHSTSPKNQINLLIMLQVKIIHSILLFNPAFSTHTYLTDNEVYPLSNLENQSLVHMLTCYYL